MEQNKRKELKHRFKGFISSYNRLTDEKKDQVLDEALILADQMEISEGNLDVNTLYNAVLCSISAMVAKEVIKDITKEND